jgi:hypothetical protein
VLVTCVTPVSSEDFESALALGFLVDVLTVDAVVDSLPAAL